MQEKSRRAVGVGARSMEAVTASGFAALRRIWFAGGSFAKGTQTLGNHFIFA